MPRLTKKSIAEALEANHANVSAAARALGCERRTIYNWLNRHPDLKEQRERSKSSLVDVAAQQLLKQITQANDGIGDTRATMFALSTWGKNDGWVQRQELTGADGRALFEKHFDADVIAYLARMGQTHEQVIASLLSSANEELRERIRLLDTTTSE